MPLNAGYKLYTLYERLSNEDDIIVYCGIVLIKSKQIKSHIIYRKVIWSPTSYICTDTWFVSFEQLMVSHPLVCVLSRLYRLISVCKKCWLMFARSTHQRIYAYVTITIYMLKIQSKEIYYLLIHRTLVLMYPEQNYLCSSTLFYFDSIANCWKKIL